MVDFSIVTVCLNSSETIAKTVGSVAAQTSATFEHILKDGGSRDGTVEIATRENPGVRVVVSPDCGIYDAMNQGYGEARGTYVAFLNSDDYYAEPDVLSAVRDTFESTGCDIVYGDIAMINRDGALVRYWVSGQVRNGRLLGKQLPFPAFFVRRAALERLSPPLDPSYQISADYKQQLLLIEKMNLRAVYLPRLLTVMLTGGESNRSIRAVMRGWQECARAHREVHGRSGWTFVALKVMSKLWQIRRGVPVRYAR